MRKKPPINEFAKRPPNAKEVNAAMRMARKVSKRLLRLMEARSSANEK